MRISRDLNIVIPVEDGDKSYHVYSRPLSRAAFEDNYLLLARAWSDMHRTVGTPTGMINVAQFAIRDAARALWPSDNGQDSQTATDRMAALMIEIRRGTTFIQVDPEKGYQQAPFENAVANKAMSPEAVGAVENALCFFILTSAMMEDRMKRVYLSGMYFALRAETTSLSTTDWTRSLETSTADATTGENKAAS